LPCVIGDLNESGLLASLEAIVALIDADSFQFQADGRMYPCLVGKPDFTAPELHGKPLSGVTRIKAHDHFGLAVTIFQLLFMGRHPYAGIQPGTDLSLDQMIAGNLFAYSKLRHTGVTPPGMYNPPRSKPLPDWGPIHAELRRRGVTDRSIPRSS
jgi:DNA-binding helix-hairpin-helix protein with protein kinase domain